MSSERTAEVSRKSAETTVEVTLSLDSSGAPEISTGVGFFDHMLTQLAFHGRLGLNLQATGDLHIDDHHTVEDVGIVLGQAIKKAIESGAPIVRYASNHTPMDESLVLCALDISGRGMLTYDVPYQREMLGQLSTECIREFFRALSQHAGITLHLRKVCGENDHHVAEATFKAFGRALYEATRLTDRPSVASTKGKLD